MFKLLAQNNCCFGSLQCHILFSCPLYRVMLPFRDSTGIQLSPCPVDAPYRHSAIPFYRVMLQLSPLPGDALVIQLSQIPGDAQLSPFYRVMLRLSPLPGDVPLFSYSHSP